MAPREAARNANRNAWPPLPGRAVADQGTDGTDGGTDGTDRWISGLEVRASQLGAFRTFAPPRRTGDDRRNVAALFRDM